MIAPLVPVQPFMGLDYVLRAFFVLIVGGLGRRLESGAFESGAFESGPFESGPFESGPFESGGFEPGPSSRWSSEVSSPSQPLNSRDGSSARRIEPRIGSSSSISTSMVNPTRRQPMRMILRRLTAYTHRGRPQS
jgi:hypothetical protein